MENNRKANLKYIENGVEKKLHLVLSFKGILKVEELFPKFNINQIITDFSLANQNNVKNDQLNKIDGLPNTSDMVRILYAGYVGGCIENSQDFKSYDQFLDVVSYDVLEVTGKFIELMLSDKKKPSNKHSKKQHQKGKKGNR